MTLTSNIIAIRYSHSSPKKVETGTEDTPVASSGIRNLLKLYFGSLFLICISALFPHLYISTFSSLNTGSTVTIQSFKQLPRLKALASSSTLPTLGTRTFTRQPIPAYSYRQLGNTKTTTRTRTRSRNLFTATTMTNPSPNAQASSSSMIERFPELKGLMDGNKKWAERTCEEMPELLPKLATGQVCP